MGPVTLQTYEKEMELGNRGGENSSQRGKLQQEHRRRTCPACPRHLKLALLQLLPRDHWGLKA